MAARWEERRGRLGLGCGTVRRASGSFRAGARRQGLGLRSCPRCTCLHGPSAGRGAWLQRPPHTGRPAGRGGGAAGRGGRSHTIGDCGHDRGAVGGSGARPTGAAGGAGCAGGGQAEGQGQRAEGVWGGAGRRTNSSSPGGSGGGGWGWAARGRPSSHARPPPPPFPRTAGDAALGAGRAGSATRLEQHGAGFAGGRVGFREAAGDLRVVGAAAKCRINQSGAEKLCGGAGTRPPREREPMPAPPSHACQVAALRLQLPIGLQGSELARRGRLCEAGLGAANRRPWRSWPPQAGVGFALPGPGRVSPPPPQPRP